LQDFNEKMLENFRKKTYDNLLSTLSKEQLNEVIILASILEKEERNLSQKSTVA
jgi:cell division protein YceG involved in septum cleavage